jgi:recombination protein RecT
MSRLAAAMQGKESRELTPYEKFRAQVDKLRPEIAAMCGRDQVDRFIRVCLNAVQANADVLQADRKTLLLACLKAAQDNLLPDGREAVFNIYNTKVKDKDAGREYWEKRVQYMPMSYGLIQKIYEAGATYVDGVAVYAADDFDYQRGDDPKIIHKPYKGTDDPGEVVAAYMVVKLGSGETKREVMFRRDIERVRQKSKAPDGLMWKDFYDQGAIKSVVHRIVKQLPRSDRLERALAHDNEVAGLADVTGSLADDGGGSNLEALVTGRLERELAVRSQDGAAEAGATQGSVGGAAAQEEPPAQPKPPKPGEPGTADLKAKVLAKMAACKDVDTLGIVLDDTRFFVWSKEDGLELQTKYVERKAALEG